MENPISQQGLSLCNEALCPRGLGIHRKTKKKRSLVCLSHPAKEPPLPGPAVCDALKVLSQDMDDNSCAKKKGGKARIIE